MKYLPHSKTAGDYIEKHEPIKLQKIEIGAKFENLNKIGPMSPSLPPDFFTL